MDELRNGAEYCGPTSKSDWKEASIKPHNTRTPIVWESALDSTYQSGGTLYWQKVSSGIGRIIVGAMGTRVEVHLESHQPKNTVAIETHLLRMEGRGRWTPVSGLLTRGKIKYEE